MSCEVIAPALIPRRNGDWIKTDRRETGYLFRIDLDEDAPYGRTIHQIAVEPLLDDDGLLIDGATWWWSSRRG